MKGIADRHKVIPAVYLLFRDGDKVLLLRRYNTSYRDGQYSFPSGHVGGVDERGGESALRAAIREAKEEVGVNIDAQNLRLVHTMHRYSDDPEPHERIDMGFEVLKWRGKLRNAEPNKCDELRWAAISALPKNTVPEARMILEKVSQGESYSDFNF